MLKLVIVEDEQPAVDNLLYELDMLDVDFQVMQVLKSVEESIPWFNSNKADMDLIFMDLQLADGISYNIFKSVNIYTPVIFTTAFDKYLLTSFEHNGIDYLLKPINQEKLNHSITKFNNLKKHFTINNLQPINYTNSERDTICKDRIIVKKGIEFQSIKAEDVAYFYTDHKLIFLVDKQGKKFLAHANNLTALMMQLNRKIFFRANRKYIININFIRKYKPCDRVKVEVELFMQCPETVVVSQENSSSFKYWIENL